MMKEPRERLLTREDIYAEYFSRQMDGSEILTKDFRKAIEEANKMFAGKKDLEVMIRGAIIFDKNYNKLFTFLNKIYKLDDEEGEASSTPPTKGLLECLNDLDLFDKFMSGDYINYFSQVENEYVNYTRVLNAHIIYELR